MHQSSPKLVEKLRNLFQANLKADSWKEQGKCWGKTTSPETDYWYVEEDDPQYKNKIVYAKRICGTCEVLQNCLEYAIVNEERYGIWGGKTLKERTLYDKARKFNAKVN